MIDGVAQFQAVFYCLGAKVEQLVNLTGNLTVAHIDVAAAISIYENIDGACHTDGVTYLHQHFVGNAGSYQILGNVAGCIAALRSTLEGSFPEKAPPPWAPLPP